MFFPYGTAREHDRFPVATTSIIAANVLVFMLQLGGAIDPFALGFVPAAPNPLTLISSMFVHSGFMHLAGNMVFLWVFGGHAENALGVKRYLLVYLSAGVGSDLLHTGICAMGPADMLEIPLLGASGAIMGVVALFALRYRKVRVQFWYFILFRMGTFELSALWTAIMYFVIDLGSGLLSLGNSDGGTAHWAHVGGFFAGAIWAFAGGSFKEGVTEEHREHVDDLFQSGAQLTALREAEKHLRNDPADAELRAQAARTYQANGEPQRAARHWGRALEVWVAHGQLEEAAAEFEYMRGRYDAALYPPDMLVRMGQVLERAGRYDTAILACRDVLAAHPSSPQAPAAALQAGLVARYRKQDLDLARRYLELIPRRWPRAAEAARAERELDDLARSAGRPQSTV